MNMRLIQFLAIGLLAASACLPHRAQAQVSNMCSYKAVTTPLTGTECWPLNQNGITKTVTTAQLFQNSVQGPGSATVGDAAIFGNTAGTAIRDAGAPPALFVADTVAMAALPTTPFAEGAKVRVGTYNVSKGINAPPVDYYLTAAACTIDNGSCFASSNISKYWHITPQSVWDVRWWGAYADIVRLGKSSNIVNTTAASCAVVMGGGSFVAADQNKLVTITDEITGSPNGQTYEGSIVTVTDATHITVSAPCPTFTTAQAQFSYYGHDDTSTTATGFNPVASAIAYLQTFANNTAGQPILTSGGRRVGACANQINISANIAVNNFSAVALCSSQGFALVTTSDCGPSQAAQTTCRYNNGMFNIGAAFTTGLDVWIDAGFLPVNACSASANGTNWWNNMHCQNWFGSGPTLTVTNASTNTVGSATGALSSCTQIGGAGNPWQCTLTLTAAMTGVVQPGNLVTGTSVPNGTYVSAFGTGTGGLGTYTVVNAVSDPTIGARTLTFIGQEITVTGGTNDLRGMISRGTANVNAGVQNRAMVVAFTGGKITLNKAPTKAFSGQTLTFSIDANGFVLSPYAGVQMFSLTAQQDSFFNFNSSNPGQMPGNQYGCSILSDAGGGSTFTHATPFYGIAQICLGPDAASNEFRQIASVNNYGGCCEFDAPAAIVMDGADNIIFDDYAPDGQIQAFWVTGGAGGPTITLNNIRSFGNTGQVLFAPANIAAFYTAVSGTSAGRVIFTPFGHNYQSGALKPQPLGFVSSASGDWTAIYTLAQLAKIQVAPSPFLPDGAGSMLMPQGIDMATSGVLGFELADPPPITGNYTFQEADTSSFMRFATPAATIGIPQSLSLGVSRSNTEWHAFFIAAAGSTLIPIGAAQFYNATIPYDNGGVHAASLALTANLVYRIDCPINPGAAVICYVSKWAN